MGTMVAGAPLLAGGPPGWLAYAALGVVTLVGGAIIVNSMDDDDDWAETTPTTGTQTQTDTDRRTCNTPYTVRIHAQGAVIGGTSGATAIGLPPVVNPSAPIPVSQGLALATGVLGTLPRRARNTLSPAKVRMDRWMTRLPASGGFLGMKSHYPMGRAGPGGDRFDCDSFGCSPNFIA